MRTSLFATAIVAVLLTVAAAGSGPPSDLDRDARALDAMLIAPCCFSQQVAVHQSAAAAEVRRDVRARLAAGQQRQEILDAYVAQYGLRILAEPPNAGFDRTLHLFPGIAGAVTLLVLVVAVRRLSGRSTDYGDPDTPPMRVAPDDDTRLDDELRDLD
jgi:cytochrome c-type biogenesis protein CcmH